MRMYLMEVEGMGPRGGVAWIAWDKRGRRLGARSTKKRLLAAVLDRFPDITRVTTFTDRDGPAPRSVYAASVTDYTVHAREDYPHSADCEMCARIEDCPMDGAPLPCAKHAPTKVVD